MAKEVGGYDYEFVSPIPEECTCPICTLVQREAHQVTCCGKIYCKSCLEQLKKKQHWFLCPNCRASLKGEYRLFPDKNTISKIKHLHIHCTNKERGCQWVGHLKDLDQQHLPKCPNEIIFCSNDMDVSVLFAWLDKNRNKCGASVQRHQMERHMTKECEWRLVTCPHCQEVGTYHHISGQHVERYCPDVLLPCRNESCPEKMKRSSLPDHYKVCPKEIVSCPYHSVGCKAQLKREDTSLHDDECMESHLDKAVTTIKDLCNQVEDLNSKVEDLNSKVEDLNSKVEDLNTQVGTLTIIRMDGLTEAGDESVSLGFYTSRGGYKISLKARFFTIISNSFLLQVSAMPGRYDDILEWPARGTIKIELLNQEKDRDHIAVTSDLILNKPEKPQKEEEGKNVLMMYVVEDEILTIVGNYKNYIVNGIAYFRVETHILHSKTKPWLVQK